VAIHKLKPTEVADLIDNVPGRHADGGGLYLQIARPGQASWVYRHREKWRSLGPADECSIEEARDRADALRRAKREGKCPIQMLDAGSPVATGKTFADAMADYLKAKSPLWSDSNRDRELRRYEYLFGQIPEFTPLPLASIDQDAKNKALGAFEVGKKARTDLGYYIAAILRYAEEGKLLRVTDAAKAKAEPHPSMPYKDVPSFYKRLGEIDAVAARALQFMILSGLRTSELIGKRERGKWTKRPATWGDVTEEGGKLVLFRPGKVMKAKKDHTVPLTAAMIKLLGKRGKPDVALFEVTRDDAMLDTLRKGDGNGYDVHGFRASFNGWGDNETNYPKWLTQLCIAHDTRSATERAYSRTDVLERRREIMTAWSDYVNS
jgi:integrase